MRTTFTESELRAHSAAGRTCKTECGCTCAAGQLVGIGEDVQGPTDWGVLAARDNPDHEPEQDLSPPVWLAALILVAAGFALGMLVEWVVELIGSLGGTKL